MASDEQRVTSVALELGVVGAHGGEQRVELAWGGQGGLDGRGLERLEVGRGHRGGGTDDIGGGEAADPAQGAQSEWKTGDDEAGIDTGRIDRRKAREALAGDRGDAPLEVGEATPAGGEKLGKRRESGFGGIEGLDPGQQAPRSVCAAPG